MLINIFLISFLETAVRGQLPEEGQCKSTASIARRLNLDPKLVNMRHSFSHAHLSEWTTLEDLVDLLEKCFKWVKVFLYCFYFL